jgi:hypothetical protein
VNCVPRSVVVQRTLGILVAVVLAVLAVLVSGRSPSPEATAPLDPSSTLGAAPSAPSMPPTTGTSTGSAPASTPASAAATSGPGLTEPGIHVVAQPAADGTLEVVERVRLERAVSALLLAPPRPRGGGAAGANPTITGFQAQAGGLVVTDAPASPLPADGERIELPVPATDITMRYRLEGSTDRSQPAPVGRVLVLLPPVTRSDPALGDPPVVVEVVGGTVRNLVCPDLPVSDQLCGRQRGAVWSTTTLPLSRASVVAQMDLPQPGAG